MGYVNIIRNINALPLNHTKACTHWLNSESGENEKQRDKESKLNFRENVSVLQPYL